MLEEIITKQKQLEVFALLRRNADMAVVEQLAGEVNPEFAEAIAREAFSYGHHHVVEAILRGLDASGRLRPGLRAELAAK